MIAHCNAQWTDTWNTEKYIHIVQHDKPKRSLADKKYIYVSLHHTFYVFLVPFSSQLNITSFYSKNLHRTRTLSKLILIGCKLQRCVVAQFALDDYIIWMRNSEVYFVLQNRTIGVYCVWLVFRSSDILITWFDINTFYMFGIMISHFDITSLE